MKSTLLSLKTRDFLKSMILFIGAPVLYELQKLIPGYNLPPLVTVGLSAGVTYLLKNLFSDDANVAKSIADENGKKLVDKNARIMPILLALCLLSVSGAFAQKSSFFKRLPELQVPTVKTSVVSPRGVQQAIFTPVVNAVDSTFFKLRPILIAGAYSLPDQHLMTGAGVSFQNITYNYATKTNYCNYSVSAVLFAGGAVAPTNPSQVVSAGFMLGFLNNSANFGLCWNNSKNNETGQWKVKPQFVVSYAVNFNN